MLCLAEVQFELLDWLQVLCYESIVKAVQRQSCFGLIRKIKVFHEVAKQLSLKGILLLVLFTRLLLKECMQSHT